ncbi:MAG: hypothetical protein CSA81_09880 [Acidobacteria bacterium]|nr:MAG: hypothetical protein CSA81_09880 [Acidobacteriota bacterium]
MERLFSPEMLTAELRNQIVGALKAKTGLPMEICEDHTSSSALRILKRHEKEPLMLTGSLFNYWLTAAYCLFLEDRRRLEGIQFVSNKARSRYSNSDQSLDFLETIAAPEEQNPHYQFTIKMKLLIFEKVKKLISELEGHCSETLLLHLEYQAQKTKAYHILNLSKSTFHTRVNRCKKKLKKQLLSSKEFIEYWETIKA